MTDMRKFTVEQVLKTPKAEILDAVRRGEGPPSETIARIISEGLAGRLRRTG